MNLTLFKYAILYHPKDGDTVLVRKPHSTLAKDAKNAALLAARLIPDQYENDLDCIEILVKEFKNHLNFNFNSCTTSNSLLIHDGSNSTKHSIVFCNNSSGSYTESFNAQNLTTT